MPEPTADFIFGTLATDEKRLARLKAERRGLFHFPEPHPRDPTPGAPITITVTTGPDVPADRVCLYVTTDGTPPRGARGVAQHGMALPMRPVASEWETLIWGYVTRWEATLPPQPDGARVRYTFDAWQSAGSGYWRKEHKGAPRLYGFDVDTLRVPDWLRAAIIYQIFVDRFAPDPGKSFAPPSTPLSGFYGGTLRGVIAKLDYIASLGVNAIWLTPFFPSPSHHGYDATDYGSVEPRLGTDEDIDTLLAEAHARGLRVILDFVANHCSHRHPAFLAAQQDRHAPTFDWFTFEEWPHRYRTFFNVQSMPQFDHQNPGARDYLIRHAVQWLERGFDGFRLDYAYGPPHLFWSDMRTATRAAKADSVMFGEVVETPRLMRSYEGRMDGCLDFLLLQHLRALFAFGNETVSTFDAFLHRHAAYFAQGENFVLPAFLDNHDMNRFLWIARNDKRRLRLALLCLFTLAGPPVVYYGTEVGLSQVRDLRHPDGRNVLEESRLPMLWGDEQDRDLLAFFRQLTLLRRMGGDVWWRTPHETRLVDDTRGLYAYAHGPYTIVLNTSDAPQTADIAGAGDVVLRTDDAIHLRGTSVALPPLSGVALLA